MVSGRTLPLPQWRGRAEEGPYILPKTEYGLPRQVCFSKADRGVFHGKKISAVAYAMADKKIPRMIGGGFRFLSNKIYFSSSFSFSANLLINVGGMRVERMITKIMVEKTLSGIAPSAFPVAAKIKPTSPRGTIDTPTKSL